MKKGFYRTKYIVLIDKYLNGEITFAELRNRTSSKRNLITYLNNYKKIYPNKEFVINAIIDNIDDLILEAKIEKKKKVIDDYFIGNASVFDIKALGEKRSVLKTLDIYSYLKPKYKKDIEELKIELYTKKEADYIPAITNYIDGKSKDFSEIYLLGSEYEVLNYLKNYITIYPDRKDEILYIVDNFDTLKNSEYERCNLIKILKKELENKSTKYIENVMNIIMQDDDKVITYLEKHKFSLHNLESSIRQFSNKYYNQKNTIEYLNNLISRYENYLNNRVKKSNSYIKYSFDFQNNKEANFFNRIYCLYLSGLSIEEFCSITGESLSDLRVLVKNRVKTDNYKDIVNEILSRRASDEFYIKMKYIADMVLNEEEFDVFDYYNITRLKVEDYREIIKDMVEPENYKKIIIKLYKTVSVEKNINKNVELNANRTINGKIVSKEDKLEIFNYLEENRYPINLYYYTLKKKLK